MQKLMQERYTAEPQNMSLNENIQKTALKILFSDNAQEKQAAEQEWNQKQYQKLFEALTATATEKQSPNALWNERLDGIITSYKVRPTVIHDEEVSYILNEHLRDLVKNPDANNMQLLLDARTVMARRIFSHYLKFDILCLQEADYLDPSMFPKNYEVHFSENPHSKNVVAWNKDRFELIKVIGNLMDRAFAVRLLDKETRKTLLVASGHFTGSNPYRIEKDPVTGVIDSAKGDAEIQAVIKVFNEEPADLMVIGMDSNVTSTHPRLKLCKDAGYTADYENFLEPTCSNPNLALDTRIDWIVLKAANSVSAKIINIPVLSVGLNSIQTNISDHKPVAAKIICLSKGFLE